MTMTKLEASKARKAGAALREAAPGSLPPEAADPVVACPFPEGDPQRVEWLEGYKEAHENLVVPTHTVSVDDAIKVASKAAAA